MLATNLKIGAVVLGTLVLYTVLANAIPQIESEVPQELSFSGEVTAEQLVAAGEELYAGAGGCTACHGLGTRAPNLTTDEGGAGTIGARCATRVQGMSCKAYLHTSLVDPSAYVVEGYQPIMPDMSRILSAAQIWALVAYLESLGGTVDVTAADVSAAGAPAGAAAPGARPAGAGAPAAPAGAAAARPGAAAPAAPAGEVDPVALMRANQCFACHALNGEGGPIGPAFDGIGARLTAADIRHSILEPNADTAQGYAAVAGVMPQNFGEQLTAGQLEAVVRFLADQR
ncbi:MAG TPA: c-type cytochrome [Longimicrobiales bacterium]